MDMEIIIEACTSRFYYKKNSIRIITKFHVLWKWNKICNFPKKTFMVFYYQVPTILLTSSILWPSKKSSSSFPNLSSLGNPKSHHHDSKLTRIQNSKLQCSMNSPCLKCHVHPNHVIILSPKHYPLCILDSIPKSLEHDRKWNKCILQHYKNFSPLW
jgi:hypothetical protein